MSRGQVALLLRDLERMRVEMGGAEEVELAPVAPPGMDAYEKGQFDTAILMSEIRGVCQEIEEGKSHSGKAKLPAAVRVARDNDLKKKVRLLAEQRKNLQEEVRRDPTHQGDFAELDGHIRKTQEFYGQATGGSTGSSSARPSPAPEMGEGPAAPMLRVEDDSAFISHYESIRNKDRQMDDALTAIEAGVGGLLGSAQVISTELDGQARLLVTIDNVVDQQQVALDGLNANVKKALKQVSSENCCMYVLCFILILAVCGGIYTLYRS